MERIVEDKVTYELSGTRLKFDHLFLNEKFSDVVLRTKAGEDVPAHRVLLAAASPVFDQTFSCESMEEENIEQVVVQFNVSREAVVAMLRYIYTGKFEKMSQLSLYSEVLKIAKKYELVELKNTCQRQLESEITTEVAIQIMADAFNITHWKK